MTRESELASDKQDIQMIDSDRLSELLSSSLKKLQDRVVLADQNGRILFINEAAAQELGYSSDEMVNRYVSEFDKKLSMKKWQIHFEESKKKRFTRAKAELIDRTGQEHFVDVINTYLQHDDQEYIFAIGRDIDDQERLERKLREFEHILDNIGNPIGMVGTDFLYKYVNKAFSDLLNLTEDEILGASVSEIIGNELFETNVKAHYEKCFKGKIINFQISVEADEADQRTYDIRYYPFRDIDGVVIAAVSNIVDITDLMIARKALNDKEIQLEAFLENIPANVYIKDINDTHVYVNQNAGKTMGKRVDELIGTTTYDFFDASMADEIIKLDKQVLESGQIISTDIALLEKDNTKQIYRDIKFPMTLVSGQKLLGGIAFDITEIKATEQKLQSAYDELNRLKVKTEKENISLREKLDFIETRTEIIGESPALKDCINEAERVAKENTTVLILGETGTGKEMLAQSIHEMSPRKGRTMIKVNCASLPANLIESELFGREKGAYTGAMSKQMGRFEIADGSTIFLDEIGDLPLELQSKLLRVLQEGTFEKLGSTKPIKIDVRVIAATNQDLHELVNNGQFRKDLYYRINVFPITVPSLRKRKEDIPRLVYAFIEEFNQSMGKSVSQVKKEDLDYLIRAEWKGNVRELRNFVERSMIMSSGPELRFKKATQSEQIVEPFSARRLTRCRF